jgi:hypothetical protein
VQARWTRPHQREALDALVKPWKINGGYRPYKPVGCVDCRMTGFHGAAWACMNC